MPTRLTSTWIAYNSGGSKHLPGHPAGLSGLDWEPSIIMIGPQHHGESITRPAFSSNLDEADMRIWLHCIHSTGNRLLIFSPDLTSSFNTREASNSTTE